jgi:PAS domain S-box-containing protein
MNLAQLNRILRLVLVVPVGALLLVAAALYWQIHNANATVAEIQSADQAIADSILIDKLIDDEETGLRGYQITRDPRFLDPFNAAQEQIDRNLDRLIVSASGDPDRVKSILGLRSAQAAWQQGFAKPLIATISDGGNTDDIDLNLQGRSQMDRIRAAEDAIVTSAEQRKQLRVRHWHAQVHTMFVVLGLMTLLVGLILGLFMRGLLHQVTDAYRQTLDILRLRAEEAFRSEEKLRTTLASIGDAVVTCDVEGRIDSVNAVAESSTGWTDREARNLPLHEVFQIVDETTGESVEDPIAKIRRLNEVTKLAPQTILIRRDGTQVAIDDSGAPIHDLSGNLTGFVIVFRDVTIARKSQAALLASEKLAVAGRLAATIAHEIHNPLDAVSNLLFLMDPAHGDSTPEERAHFLELARQEIARVTQISRAMLSLYRESAAPVPVDVREMLESLLLLMDRRFQDLGVNVTTDLPNDARIHGFPAELRQVFTNLLTNAAEAAGEDGQISITAHHTKGLAAKDMAGRRRQPGVLITISDNGPGIPDDVRPRLFEPFFTTKGERGTGLGLWVSRGIVTRHNGSIEIESNTTPERHGTSVMVFLAIDPILQAVVS